MPRLVFFMLCLTFSAIVHVKCKKNCDTLGTLVYEDLGCTPVVKEGQHCPVKYDCGDLTQKENSCLFKGKQYGLNEAINNDLTYGSCEVGCFCGTSLGKPKFTCAVLDCPDWLGVPIEQGCFRKYALDKCCSVGTICPSKGETLAECKVDGNKIKEGGRFWPKNTCLQCICDKNWNGKFEAPFCSKQSCNVQIRHAEELQNSCAPVYFGEDALCCPDTWACPSSSDVISKVNNKVDPNSELTCVFGSKTLKLGEGFQRKIQKYDTEKNFQCECVLPPFLTCKEI